SVTGTLAGQIVIQGFLKIRISLWMRRLITMIPALIVIYMGVNSIKVLVLSQVVLSFQLPFTIIPLILFTRNKQIMGEYVNRQWVNILAYVCAAIIIGLNIYLLYQVFSGNS
ncbi:MAG TPA: divalent metal cation transporter, partial [candidate division Zixibacteria bacterium]|nr:divalent metal cation transporter [candidate division Zixibacteria bacterium]